jgi:hypothetical protein
MGPQPEYDLWKARERLKGELGALRSIESSKLWFIFGKTHRATMDVSDTLPDDIDTLRALPLAERASRAAIVAERDKLIVRNERLEAIIAEIRRAHFGRKSERITSYRSRWRSSRPRSPRPRRGRRRPIPQDRREAQARRRPQ